MALKPLAGPDGDVSIDDDFSFESLGDPALDRILLRCHVVEAEVRQLAANVQRIQRAIDGARSLLWILLAVVSAIAIIEWLTI